MPDPRTIATYDAQAQTYDTLVASGGPDKTLRDFIALIPAGGRVLDLGCGPGTAAAHMQAAGLRPDPIDASPKMVAIATDKYGLPARLASFDDVNGAAEYDGVWANFSLLHAPRGDLPRHIDAISAATKTGGVLHIGMKTGTGAARDKIDRLYTYVSVTELHDMLVAAGYAVTYTKEGQEAGLAGTIDPFVIMRGKKL